MIHPSRKRIAATRPLIQRVPLAVREDEEDDEVQRQADANSAANVATSLASNIHAMNGFGTDFGDVRVHTDSRAAETARSISAEAFTVGQNVAFDTSRYAPEMERN